MTARKRPEEDLAPAGDCKEGARGASSNLGQQGRGQRKSYLQLGAARKRPEEVLSPAGDCKEEARGRSSSNW